MKKLIMAPGVNNQPRNTGTMPKSNRRSDRNRQSDRSEVNQNSSYYDRSYRASGPQHPNNLFQFDWHPVSERQSGAAAAAAATTTTTTTTTFTASRSAPAKNSNARSTCSACDYDHLGPYNSHSKLYPNLYARDDSTFWLKMTPPLDSRAQSPSNISMKPTNTDKMPERSQVEGRLNQIREYIKVTSTMMDSLSQSRDPRAEAQHEKLSRMVEDLYDSEQKLTKLMENCQKYWSLNENGELESNERSREQELMKKVEDSQRKLAQLQERQAELVGLQLSVRERLNEARQAQRLLGDEEDGGGGGGGGGSQQQLSAANVSSNVEQLERETEALRGKLQQLEDKKRHMDHLVQELQAVDMADRASCSSEGSRTPAQRDKAAELEAMKAQLKHLKALMNEVSRGREESGDEAAVSEPEHDDDDEVANNVPTTNGDFAIHEIVENDVNVDANSYNSLDEIRPKMCSDPPTVQQIQAVTRELKEQQQLLLAARTELRRLKQPGSTNPTPSVTSTTPPPMLMEKKLSNHTASNNDVRLSQNKRRQLEEYMRKDQSHSSSVNQNGTAGWGSSSRRDSNSQHSSHVSTPANLWPPPANPASVHDHNLDGPVAAENLLEMAAQPPVMNGFGGNYWEMPGLMNQTPQGTNAGSAEYYRQLLLGSQALQLQMMSTTIQQCCQLLWAQQREMQTMKAAITHLQSQLRQSQSRASNNLDLSEEHSNLGRAAQQQQHYSTLDAATLPPSSSLPNLVSLPNPAPGPPSAVPVAAGCQQQQQQQLNNQVPPGNRANNYWDNFRSYSRQNLLSASPKTSVDASSSTSTHPPLSTNTATTSHVNNKCNRHPIDLDNNHPSAAAVAMAGAASAAPETLYSLNLQPQQQQQERESATLQNNCVLSNETQQQQVEAQQSRNVVTVEGLVNAATTDEGSSSQEEKMRLKVLLKRCLKVLDSRPENESPLPSSNISNSSDSSDDEDDECVAVETVEEATNNVCNVNAAENQLPDFIEPASVIRAYSSPLPEFLEHECQGLRETHNVENNINCSLTTPSSVVNNSDVSFEPDSNRTETPNNNQQVSVIASNWSELNAEELNPVEDDEINTEYEFFEYYSSPQTTHFSDASKKY